MQFSKSKISMFFLAILFVVLLIFAGSIFETNDEGFFQIKQAAFTGEMSVRNNPGMYMQNFGSIFTYKQVATIGIGDQKGEGSSDLPAVKVIFNDGSKADISALVRVSLPQDDETQLQLKKKFSGGYDHFIRAGVVPIVENAIKLSANLRSAQDAYTTLALFQQAIEDQLKNGTYVTKSDKVFIERATGDREEQKITAVVTYPEDSDLIGSDGLPLAGRPMRMQHPFKELGCTVQTCVIGMPAFDPKVEEMIAKRKDEAMKTELAKQAAIRAKQDALTAEEQGKANVATAKYEKEVELVQATTKAREEYEVEQFSAMKAKETAKKIVAEGDAKAAANRALVAAGLTPQQKMEMQIKIAEVVSANVAKAPTPQVVMLGSDSKGGSPAEEAMKVFGAERAIELINKVNTGIK